jgi:hypothetical protein
MTRPTHREAVQAFLAARGVQTRPQAKRLYMVKRPGWSGCAAYIEFDDPDSTAWAELPGGLLGGCQLRAIPLEGRRNWDYCARVEGEIAAVLDEQTAGAAA